MSRWHPTNTYTPARAGWCVVCLWPKDEHSAKGERCPRKKRARSPVQERERAQRKKTRGNPRGRFTVWVPKAAASFDEMVAAANGNRSEWVERAVRAALAKQTTPPPIQGYRRHSRWSVSIHAETAERINAQWGLPVSEGAARACAAFIGQEW